MLQRAISTIERLFVAAPLSILPLLSKTSRMDLLDLYKAQQDAIVSNRWGGESRLLYMSKDSIALATSATNSWHLKISPDSSLRVTYLSTLPDTLSQTQHFTKSWKPKH